MIILPGGCNAFLGSPPGGGSDDDFARYGFVNGIIVLKPCQVMPADVPRNAQRLPTKMWGVCVVVSDPPPCLWPVAHCKEKKARANGRQRIMQQCH